MGLESTVRYFIPRALASGARTASSAESNPCLRKSMMVEPPHRLAN